MLKVLKVAARILAQPAISLMQQFVSWRIHRTAIREGLPHLTTRSAITIVLLSYNRFDETKRCIRSIIKHVTVPFSLKIIDNGSSRAVRNRLSKLCEPHSNITLVLEEVNHGCAGGRNLALEGLNSEYVLFLDNDIIVYPHFLEHLVSRLEKDELAAGACCKVIFPNGIIQYNGGSLERQGVFAVFGLLDDGKKWNDRSTEHETVCEWIPGGATIWRSRVLLENRIDTLMDGEYEDNELSYRLREKGFRLLNSPHSFVVHRHFRFQSQRRKWKERDYYANRRDALRSRAALSRFFNAHGSILVYGNIEDFCVAHYGTLDGAKIAVELASSNIKSLPGKKNIGDEPR